MASGEGVKLAAPCGLYCGSCIDYLTYKTCHGCGCDCGECNASRHHERCEVYRCCLQEKGVNACSECKDFPCSILIRFCYNPVWLHHLPVIENLRRRKILGTERWLREQNDSWSNKWYLKRWLWLQKKCEKHLEDSVKEVDT